MFSNLTDRAQRQLSDSLPFVLYSKPKEAIVHALFQNEDGVHHISDFTETGFVFAPFDAGESVILLKADEKLQTTEYPKLTSTARNVPKYPMEAAQRDFHLGLVGKAVRTICDSELEKVVISRCLEVPAKKSTLHLFEQLLVNYPAAFCYLWYHPKIGCWLGATPEILLRTHNNRFTTMSLAGTQPYIEGKMPIWSAKELEEQLLVTRYIEKALDTKVVDLQIKDVESIRAGNLWHLRTKIEGRMQGVLKDLINALHPTPAVCGLPRQKAQDFILANEGYPRTFYTGYLGELNLKVERNRASTRKNTENTIFRSLKSITELFVNLRCMQLQGDKARIYVGGGITAASDPVQEWEETISKSMTLLRVLQYT